MSYAHSEYHALGECDTPVCLPAPLESLQWRTGGATHYYRPRPSIVIVIIITIIIINIIITINYQYYY